MTQQTRAYNVHADSDKPLIVEGLPIVFDQPAQIGDVTEVIARTALDGVDLSNITLQVNHDNQSIPLARSPETMTLTITEKGLAMTATLPDTERGRELHTAIKRGDIQGAKTLSLPMQMLGADLQARKVVYQNNPILKWCLTNTGIQTDRNGNIVPIKNQSPRQRIDGAAALLDCYVGLYEHYNEFINAI